MILTQMALTLITSMATPVQAAPDHLLTDFDSGGVALRWYSVNDGVMGGRSSGSFRIEDGQLLFRGLLNTNGGGFASLRTRTAALDLADRAGIHLRVRGDGRVYTMRLQQDSGRGRSVSYRAEFRTTEGPEWQDVWLPFGDFVPTWRGRILDLPPVDPARVSSIGLMIADKIDGEFQLRVDSIGAFDPFRLPSLRAKQRPLVIFAPDEDDRRLRRQLSALATAGDGLRDREMALIVVLGKGTSVAGTRPLTASEVATIRGRFAVAGSDFAVRLVGKDGKTKRSASRPVEVADLFALVDAMPMRQAEVAARKGRD